MLGRKSRSATVFAIRFGCFMQKLVYVCLMLLTVSLANPLAAQDFPIIRMVLVEGDEVPGVGVIDSIGDVAINDLGETLIVAGTDAPTANNEVLLRNGKVLLQEGIMGQLTSPPDAFIAGAEPFAGLFTSLSISNSGETAYFLSIEDFPGSQDFGIFLGTDVVVQQGGLANSPQFSAGTTYDFLFALEQNNTGTMLFTGLADDPNLGTGLDECIVMTDGITEIVVVADGDMLPGSDIPVTGIGAIDNLSAINDNNDVMYVVEFGTGGAGEEDSAIYINDTLIACEGQPSAVPGRNWGPLDVSGLDLNDSGDYAFKGLLDGNDLLGEQLVVKNGEVVMREGDIAPDGNPILNFGMLSGPIEIGNNGSVIYQARSTDMATFLYLDDQLIVHEGVTTTENGTVITDITSLLDVADSSEVMDLSSDGTWAIFEGRIVSPTGQTLEAAFTIQFEDVGGDGGTVQPAELDVFRGITNSGGLAEVLASDDSRLQMNPGFTIGAFEAPVWLIFDAALAGDAPSSLVFDRESSAGTPGLTVTTEAFNWITNAFEVVDATNEVFMNDTVVSVDLSGGVSDFVEPGTGNVRSRVGWRQTGFTINFPWEARIDQISWTFAN